MGEIIINSTIHAVLNTIQHKLKSPKNLTNTFYNFKYRSCENILENLKPHLAEHKVTLTLTDTIISLNNKFFIEATATLTNCQNPIETISTSAIAELDIDNNQKMSKAQQTGACSSYARKYALNGLFAIDDNKDDDFTNQPQQITKKEQEEIEPEDIPIYKPTNLTMHEIFNNIVAELKEKTQTPELLLRQKLIQTIRQSPKTKGNMQLITDLTKDEIKEIIAQIINE